MNYQRHTLCYLTPHAEPITANAADHSLLDYWLSENFPLIFTHQPQHLESEHIQLAIPYFDEQTQQKIRLSYLFTESAISHSEPLPRLQELFPEYKSSSTTNMTIYGSYCWQYLTQKQYVHPSSDLDVLISYQHESLTELAKLYDDLLKKLPVAHIDGEIHFAHFGDCSWLELLHSSASDTILFKSERQIELVPRERLYAAFPTLLA